MEVYERKWGVVEKIRYLILQKVEAFVIWSRNKEKAGHNDQERMIEAVMIRVFSESIKGVIFSIMATENQGIIDMELDQDDIMSKYMNFKKFDVVGDYSDHHYSKSKSSWWQARMLPGNWAKKIQEEWRILERHLPDKIFVRVYDGRMDLLRAVIIGAEGTPYHEGLFFFDICFPENYPIDPPQVYYHSGGLRINPNLYDCGKVCLSLLNTWRGVTVEKWQPAASTMLQVLVSIQGLILNEKPYFNEPAYERSRGTVNGEKLALEYDQRTLVYSLKTMVYSMRKPPKHFEDLVIGHFRNRASDILTACRDYYMKDLGVKYGIVVVDETGCSRTYKSEVKGYMKTLVGAFKQIGVKEDLEAEFAPLTENPTVELQKKEKENPTKKKKKILTLAKKILSWFSI
ncbi:putative ubiquitin-conjugating enzyme E2 38 [Bidens hawaiensis]|uniref:putative ubiquitin-conjugating enzyme E2 38 n=1 Tax=Bidens hawaiensis TaxID=980011 RepID=UPI0040492DDF